MDNNNKCYNGTENGWRMEKEFSNVIKPRRRRQLFIFKNPPWFRVLFYKALDIIRRGGKYENMNIRFFFFVFDVRH